MYKCIYSTAYGQDIYVYKVNIYINKTGHFDKTTMVTILPCSLIWKLIVRMRLSTIHTCEQEVE